ncbi:MAG: transcription antitermination factor NusB [Candidatus Margulisiibacteriota bacterium]
MSKRANSRKMAMRMIYQHDIRNQELTSIFEDLDKSQYAEETVDWAFKLAETTVNHIDSIDEIIAKYSIDWAPDRLNRIDRALLRIGIAEINHTDTPFQVVINEIIEISKIYSTEESAKFINGILDKYVKDTCLQDS